MKILGLTGGIGSGKSTVAARLAHHGIPVIDADKIGHQLLDQDTAVSSAIAGAFGAEVLTEARIDREKLARKVFADADARKRLNDITHPAIVAEVRAQVEALAAAGHTMAVVEAALIAEQGKRDPWLHALILVRAPESLRKERLMLRRGLSEQEAAARIAAQTPPERKLALADYLVDNGGDLTQLHARVDALVEELRDAFG